VLCRPRAVVTDAVAMVAAVQRCRGDGAGRQEAARERRAEASSDHHPVE